MENITMWAERKSSANAMDAKTRASYTTSGTTIISNDDVAKVKKDAYDAIEKQVKSQKINNEAKPSISPAQDAEYMEAVESGDMDKAARMFNYAARKAGYTSTND